MGELVWNGSDFVDQEAADRRAAGFGDFNDAAYLAANPDVAADPYYGKNPYEHWIRMGQWENRKTDPNQKLGRQDSIYASSKVDPANYGIDYVMGYEGDQAGYQAAVQKAIDEEAANPTYRMTGGEAGSTVYYDNLGRRIEVNKDWNEKYGGGAGGFGWGDTKNFLDTVKITDKNGKPVSLAEIDKQQGVKNFVEAIYDFRQSRQRPGPKGGALRGLMPGGNFFGSNPLKGLANVFTAGATNALGLTNEDTGFTQLMGSFNPITNITEGIGVGFHGDELGNKGWEVGLNRLFDVSGGKRGPVDMFTRAVGSGLPEEVRAVAPTLGSVGGSYFGPAGYIGGHTIGNKLQQGMENRTVADTRRVLKDAGVDTVTSAASAYTGKLPFYAQPIVAGGVSGAVDYALTGDTDSAWRATARGAIGNVTKQVIPAIKGEGRGGNWIGNAFIQGAADYGKGKLFESLGLTPQQEQQQVASTWRPRTPEEVEAEADKEVGRKPVTAEDFPGGQFVWHPGTPPQFTTIQTSPQQFTGGEMPAMPTFNVSGGSKDVVVDPRRIDLSETAASRVAQDIKESPQRTLSSLYGVQSVGIGGRGRIGRQAPRVRGGTRLGDARTIT